MLYNIYKTLPIIPTIFVLSLPYAPLAIADLEPPVGNAQAKETLSKPDEPLFPNGSLPSKAFVETIVEQAKKRKIDITRDEIIAASPYFEKNESKDQIVATTKAIATILGTACSAGALGAFSLELGRGIAFNFSNGSEGGPPPSGGFLLERTGSGCLCGMMGVYQAKVAIAKTKGTLLKNLVSEKTSVATRVMSAVTEKFSHDVCANAYNLWPEKDLFGELGCIPDFSALRSDTKSEIKNWIDSCLFDAVLEEFSDELALLDQLLSNLDESGNKLIVTGFSISGSDYIKPTFSASDVIKIGWSVVPATSEGTWTLEVIARNGGVEKRVDSISIGSFTEDEVAKPYSAEVSIDANQLVDLNPGDDPHFFLYFRFIHSSGWEVTDKRSDLDGVSVFIDTPSNEPPSIISDAVVEDRQVTFKGSYEDLDYDAASYVKLFIDSGNDIQEIDLTGDLTKIGSSPEYRFERELMLNNGIYEYWISYSDGQVTRTSLKESIRVSDRPPTVSVKSSKNQAEIGELVPVSVEVNDAAGPVSNVEVSLASDLKSYFHNGSGNTIRKIDTSEDGKATFEYEPRISGTHTILVMDQSFEYGYTTIEVDGDPEDWVAEWSFSLQDSSDSEAIYQVQVYIESPQGQLDSGDEVLFEANHGSFSPESDQVGTSSIATTDYTLTKTEDELGSESFSAILPEYDVSLNYSTELSVGEPDKLKRVMTSSYFGDGDERESFSVDYSEDGRYMAYLKDESNVVIKRMRDFSTVNSVRLSNLDDLNCLAFSPSGEHIVVGDRSGNIAKLTVDTGSYSYSSFTNGSADILNLDWFDTDRIAVATGGGTSTSLYSPRALILDNSLAVKKTVTFPGVEGDEDLWRISCSAESGLCATADIPYEQQWFLFTIAGDLVHSEAHPEQEDFTTMRFSNAGDRLFVGAYDFNGAAMADLYEVSSSGVMSVTDPATSNTRVYASSFVSTSDGERLIIGGDNKLEVFPATGDGALLSTNDPNGGHEESYHLEYVPARNQLIAVTNYSQSYYNLSDDQAGPSISVKEPGILPYSQTSVRVNGNIIDSSAIILSEYRVSGGRWRSLSLADNGDFSIYLEDVPVGQTTIEIYARDYYFNSTDVSLTVERDADTSDPLVSAVDVDPSNGVPGQIYEIAATVRDSESGVDSVEAKVNDDGGNLLANIIMNYDGNETYIVDYDSSGLSGGKYWVDILASDQSSSKNETLVERAAGFVVCDLIESLNLSNETFVGTSVFEACNSIMSENSTVQDGASITFRVGREIRIGTGFRIQRGGVFRAVMDDRVGVQ